MSSLVYFFLSLYYFHACTGRPLAVFDQENSSQIQLSGKVSFIYCVYVFVLKVVVDK